MSDIHTGSPHCRPELLQAAIEETKDFAQDLAAVAGDLTSEGYLWECGEAKKYLDRVECPNVVVIVGNPDAKNVGYRHFEDLFGARTCTVTLPVPEGKAKVVAPASTVSNPSEVEVGREHYGRLDSELRGWDRGPKIVMVRYHISPCLAQGATATTSGTPGT